MAVKMDGGRAPQDHRAEGVDYQPDGQKPTTQHLRMWYSGHGQVQPRNYGNTFAPDVLLLDSGF